LRIAGATASFNLNPIMQDNAITIRPATESDLVAINNISLVV
jgi:hypothetical protein